MGLVQARQRRLGPLGKIETFISSRSEGRAPTPSVGSVTLARGARVSWGRRERPPRGHAAFC